MNHFLASGFLSLFLAFSLPSKANPVPGFGAQSQNQSSPLSHMDTDGASQAQLFKVHQSQMEKKLVWSVWLEKVDGSIYSGLQPGLSSESLLVFFKLSPNKDFVHLFEVKANPNDLTGESLINRFPVLSSSGEEIVFDFSSGLKKRFFKSFIDPKNPLDLQIEYSFTDRFKNEKNSVTFMETLKLNDKNQSTLIMHHAFRLFEENTSFKPLSVTNPLSVGFMPAAFSKAEGEAVIRRFDSSKSLVFSISSNTPKEYVNAVKDGLLWWNEAFGFDFIQVKVLEKPVRWADARFNIFQWSDDPGLCAGAGAIGPSEANPVTGEIYSGKIVFCGSVFSDLYEAGADKEKITKEEFLTKVIRWATAHELGHVLGFSHNFKGKLLEKRKDVTTPISNSTVMDYPHPDEILAYDGVGVRDTKMIKYSYLDQSPQSLEEVKAIPYCTDADLQTQLDCNQFVRGGLDPVELSQRYIDLIESKSQFPPIEHNTRKVIIKIIFANHDSVSKNLAEKLFRHYPGNKSLLIEELVAFAEGMRPGFLSLSEGDQAQSFQVLKDLVMSFDLGFTFKDKKSVIETISKFKVFAAYDALQGIKIQLEDFASNSSNIVEVRQLMAFTELKLSEFWSDENKEVK